jgi:hypothetical protein
VRFTPIAFALSLALAAPASATLIDFEDVEPGFFGPTLVVGDVTFSSPVNLLVANYFSEAGVNRALCPLSPALIGCESDLSISFANPISRFDITVDGANSTVATISAFATLVDDSVQAILFDGFEPFQSKVLSYASATPIRAVRFSTRDPQGFSFDDLRLNGSAVPEPGVWVLALLGFGLVGQRLRHARIPASAI